MLCGIHPKEPNASARTKACTHVFARPCSSWPNPGSGHGALREAGNERTGCSQTVEHGLALTEMSHPAKKRRGGTVMPRYGGPGAGATLCMMTARWRSGTGAAVDTAEGQRSRGRGRSEQVQCRYF